MTKEEVKKLILEVRSGNSAAWESLYHNFEGYVHDRASNRLKKLDMPAARKADMEMDLFQAGWLGFLSAVRGYDAEPFVDEAPNRGKYIQRGKARPADLGDPTPSHG